MAVGRNRARVSALMLLVALLPTLTYVGHWGTLASAGATASAAQHAHEHEADQTHEQHCHGAVAGCAGGELSTGTGSLPGALLVLEATLAEVASFESVERLPNGLSIAPVPPPPQTPPL